MEPGFNPFSLSSSLSTWGASLEIYRSVELAACHVTVCEWVSLNPEWLKRPDLCLTLWWLNPPSCCVGCSCDNISKVKRPVFHFTTMYESLLKRGFDFRQMFRAMNAAIQAACFWVGSIRAPETCCMQTLCLRLRTVLVLVMRVWSN